MASPRTASLLELTEDLERRDTIIAAETAQLTELAKHVTEIARRAAAVDELLDRIPGDLASLDRLEAELRDRRSGAQAELAAAGERATAVERSRHPSTADRDRAAHELARAETAVSDLDTRLDRMRSEQAHLREAEKTGRLEIAGLAVEAEAVAGLLASLARVSESGGSRPQPGLVGLVAWAARAHAALLVARSQLDIERDRLLREANELATVVLGEQTAGSTVELVSRRVKEVLRG